MDDKYNVRKSREPETFDFGFAILDFGLKKEKLLDFRSPETAVKEEPRIHTKRREKDRRAHSPKNPVAMAPGSD